MERATARKGQFELISSQGLLILVNLAYCHTPSLFPLIGIHSFLPRLHTT